jgi:hypothetical protein
MLGTAYATKHTCITEDVHPTGRLLFQCILDTASPGINRPVWGSTFMFLICLHDIVFENEKLYGNATATERD